MVIFHCVVFILNIANAVTPASSVKLTGSTSKDREKMDEINLMTQSRRQRMTVPRILQKSVENSNSLSFAFTLPVQHRIIPLKSSAWKKQFNSPVRNLTVLKNSKQRVHGLQYGYKQQMQRLGRQRGVNSSKIWNTNKTFEMVGQPLAFKAHMKGGNRVQNGVGVPLNSQKALFGATTGNSTGRLKTGWKQSPANNYYYKGTSLVKHLKHTSAPVEKTPLDEEIIVMGAPLIFTKEGKGEPYISKHINNRNPNYALHNSNITIEDMYKGRSGDFLQRRPNTSEQVLGAQNTNESSNRMYFHNKTTIQDDTEVNLSQKHKNNKTDTFLSKNFHNHGNKLLLNQSTTLPSQELTSGNGTVKIYTSQLLHNNNSLQYPHAATSDKEAPQQIGPQSQTEQNHSGVFYEYDQEPTEFNTGQGSGLNVTGYQENDTNEHYDDEENDVIYADQVSNQQENLPPFPEESFNDRDKDQGNVNDDDQFEGSPVHPASNQRYMPVDEFGSPFYGNKTDDYFQREALAAHNRYRAIHNSPPLELSSELSKEAEQFAKRLAALGVARHEINRNLKKEREGDNVARGCSEWGGLTASGAVHRWYTQVCYYNWNKRAIQPEAKNFMQMIWKGTRHLGIGRAFGRRRGLPCTFIVARYKPGRMNAYELDSNVDKGSFLPSYCNADGDEGLMSTGYPSTFFPTGANKQNDEPSHGAQFIGISRNNAALPNSINYYPLGPLEKNIDEQDVRGLLRVQPDANAQNSLLPRVTNLAVTSLDDDMSDQDDVSFVGDEDDFKRTYKAPKRSSDSAISIKKSNVEKA